MIHNSQTQAAIREAYAVRTAAIDKAADAVKFAAEYAAEATDTDYGDTHEAAVAACVAYGDVYKAVDTLKAALIVANNAHDALDAVCAVAVTKTSDAIDTACAIADAAYADAIKAADVVIEATHNAVVASYGFGVAADAADVNDDDVELALVVCIALNEVYSALIAARNAATIADVTLANRYASI